MAFISPTTQYGVDSSTLHRWILNDASGPTFANKGSSSSTTLTIQNTSNVNLGDVGLYSDCANFTQAGASSGWSASANNVGIPTSTTQISLSLWVKPRSFTNSFPRLLAKGYNPAFTNPYDSLGIYLATNFNPGTVALEWSSSGSLIQVALGPTTTTARGYILLDVWQHIAVTISIAAGTATLNYYWNGALVTNTTFASGSIDWNSGSSGAWSVGGVIAGAPIGNATFDGWMFDARVDDGVIRSAAYWKAMYKSGQGYIY
jgi:hypothetical protein